MGVIEYFYCRPSARFAGNNRGVVFCSFLQEIEQTLDHSWALEEMATRCGVKRIQFSNIIKQVTGSRSSISTGSGLKKPARSCGTRIGRLRDVTFDCGYGSSQYFAEAFKKHARMTDDTEQDTNPQVVYDASGNLLLTWFRNGFTLVMTTLDSDGAGLADGEELGLGTSVHSSDSDGDGLSDYAEIRIYGTLPLVADTEGDGLPDGWEAPHGINPLVDDTIDNPDGDWHNNQDEYIAGTDPTNGYSFFTAANTVVEVNGTNCFVVEWISIPDRLYSVQWSTNLVSGFQFLETGIEHPQNSYTDTTHNAES